MNKVHLHKIKSSFISVIQIKNGNLIKSVFVDDGFQINIAASADRRFLLEELLFGLSRTGRVEPAVGRVEPLPTGGATARPPSSALRFPAWHAWGPRGPEVKHSINTGTNANASRLLSCCPLLVLH